MWLNWLERSLRVREIPGSSPGIPTIKYINSRSELKSNAIPNI